MNATSIALALAGVVSLCTGLVRAETEETTWTYTGSNGTTQTVQAEETPEVLGVSGSATATAIFERVTVTCSKICQAMNGNGSTPPSGLDLVNLTSASGGGDANGGGGTAPSPAPPPASSPPPQNKADCLKDCDNDRKVRDLKCSNESYYLWRDLQTAAVAARRAQLILKGIKNPYVSVDTLPEAVLDDITQKQTSFDKFCANVSDQAQLWCYTQKCGQLGSFIGLPFLLVPAAGFKRRG